MQFETLINAGCEMFMRDGALGIKFVAVADDHVLMGEPQFDHPPSTQEKSVAAYAMGHMMAEQGVKVEWFAFMSEVWFAVMPKAEYERRAVAPSEHPQRREALMFTQINLDGQCVMTMMEIVRRENGLVELQPTDDQGHVESPITAAILQGYQEGRQ